MMKKLTKRILIIALCLSTAVCSIYLYNNKVDIDDKNVSAAASEKSTDNLQTNTPEPEFVMRVESYADMLYDFSDNQTLSELSDYIAVIRIDTVDGVTNISSKTGKPVSSPYSYGKATVVNVIKGSLPNEISYIRNGGMMTYDKWVAAKHNPEKLRALKAESEFADVPEDKLYVDSSTQGDINIEIGKEYIAFMCRDDLYNSDNEFVIQGFQYGLRELQNQGTATVGAQSGDNLRVKNNVTGEWEKISDIVYLGQPQKTVSDAFFD